MAKKKRRKSGGSRKGVPARRQQQKKSSGAFVLGGVALVIVTFVVLLVMSDRKPVETQIAEPRAQTNNDADGSRDTAQNKPDAPAPVKTSDLNEDFWNGEVEKEFGDDNNAKTAYQTAVRWFTQGSAQNAKAGLESLLANAPADADWLPKAKLLLIAADMRNNPDKAVTDAGTWARENSKSDLIGYAKVIEGQAWTRKVQARKNTEITDEDTSDLAKAQEAFAAALAAGGNVSADAQLHRGHAYRAADEPEKAAEAYKAVVDGFPSSPLAPKALSAMYKAQWSASDYDGARASLRRLQTEYPSSQEANRARNDAQALAVLGKPARDWAAGRAIYGKKPRSLADSKERVTYLLFLETW